MLGTILNVEDKETSTKKLETKKKQNKKQNSWRCIRLYILEKTQTDCMCQEKKEEEDSLAFKIASMHQYID